MEPKNGATDDFGTGKRSQLSQISQRLIMPRLRLCAGHSLSQPLQTHSVCPPTQDFTLVSLVLRYTQAAPGRFPLALIAKLSLEPCCSKRGPQIGNTNIIWRLVRNAGSQVPSKPSESEPTFQQDPQLCDQNSTATATTKNTQFSAQSPLLKHQGQTQGPLCRDLLSLA